MDNDKNVRQVRGTEVHVLARLLAQAFEQQPVHQWVLPTEAERRRVSHRVFGIAIRRTLDDGLALTTQSLEGVALWLPPYAPRTRFPRDLLFGLEALYLLRTRFLRSLRANRAMARASPRQPYWYLLAIGTDPRVQGRGIASRLMASVLSRCDAEGTPAYLETASKSNVAFYEARDFAISSEFSITAEGPCVWSMCRQPHPQVGASNAAIGHVAPNQTDGASVDADSEPPPFSQRALRSRGLWSIAVVMVGAVLLARWLQSTGGIAGMRAHYGNSVAFVAVLMQALLSLSPVPSQIVAIPTAVVFGFWLGATLLWTGWLLAAFVQYALARYTAKELDFEQILKRLPRRIRELPAHHPAFLILTRWFPAGYHVVNTVAGAYEVPLFRHAWCAAVSIVPRAVFLSAVANGLASAWW